MTFNTEDWWAVLIGLVAFALLIPLCVYHVPMPAFGVWSQDITDAFSWKLLGLAVLVPAIVAPLWVALACLKDSRRHLPALLSISGLVLLAKLLAAQQRLRHVGLGDAIWTIVLGFLVVQLQLACRWLRRQDHRADVRSDETPHRDALREASSAEFFIKISVVLLITDVMQLRDIGWQGLCVAGIDTPVTLFLSYKLGLWFMRLSRAVQPSDKLQCIVMASALTICGSSAAAAVGSAVGTSKKDIGVAVAIMAACTAPQIPTLPFLGETLVSNNTQLLGAWLGGAVDSTGAVVASATLLGPSGLRAAILVKMLQNSLIGPVALVLAAVFSAQAPNEASRLLDDDPPSRKTRLWAKLKLVWSRFPKFIVGFLATSAFTSTFIPAAYRADLQADAFVVSEWFAGMGFVCIGMDLGHLVKVPNKAEQAPYIALFFMYVSGQAIDLALTFLVAWTAFAWL